MRNNLNFIGGTILNFLFNEWITHVPIHFVRISFLRLFNKKIHKKSRILMHTRILNFWRLEIGVRSIVNQYCLLDCRRLAIRIAHDVDIGPYTRIWTLGHDPNSNTHALYGGEVILEHHVWVASGVTIMPGVTLREGTVAGANSLVIKSTAPKEIVAGVPAKFIRYRENALEYQINYNVILE